MGRIINLIEWNNEVIINFNLESITNRNLEQSKERLNFLKEIGEHHLIHSFSNLYQPHTLLIISPTPTKIINNIQIKQNITKSIDHQNTLQLTIILMFFDNFFGYNPRPQSRNYYKPSRSAYNYYDYSSEDEEDERYSPFLN